MMKLRIGLLGLLFAALPGVAHAQGGWWDNLEQWSGPGPFGGGFVVDARIGCFTTTDYQQHVNDEAKKARKTDPSIKNPSPWIWLAEKRKDEKREDHRPCSSRDPNVGAGYIDIRYQRGKTPNQSLFADRPNELIGVVTEQMLQSLVMFQVTRTVAVGGGLGMTWLSGPTLDQSVHPFVLTPVSVSVAPFRLFPIESDKGWIGRLSRVVTLNMEEFVVMGTFDAHSFNSTSTSFFRSGSDFRTSVFVAFDAFALFD
jgi:hypothetical protein